MLVVKADVVHKFSELRFIKDSISIRVNTLELRDKVAKELFMLAELEVQHTLQESMEFELGLGVFYLLLVKLSSC